VAVAGGGLTALAVLVLGIALVATVARGGWLGFVVAAVVLAVLVPRARLPLAVGGAVLVATLVGFGFIGSVGGRLSPGGSDSPLDMLGNRAGVWSAALGMLWDHPLFGVGIADFVNYYPQYSAEPYGLNHAHDLFLNVAAERGLLGVATFAAVLIGLFRSMASSFRRALGRSDKVLAAGLIASFVGYLPPSPLE